MQISRTLGGCSNGINGRYFPTNSIVLRLENNTILICQNFRKTHNNSVELFCYLPKEKKWVKTYANNKYTKIMFQYYQDNKPKRKRNKTNYVQLMRHDRKHKKGGGGKISHTQTVTDYECRKIPFHDFSRTFH